MAVMGTYRDRPREAESGEVQSSPAFRPTGVSSSTNSGAVGVAQVLTWRYDPARQSTLGASPMKRIAVGFGFMVTAMAMTLMNANAQDCPSGHYYRMSGRCADASGHKVMALQWLIIQSSTLRTKSRRIIRLRKTRLSVAAQLHVGAKRKPRPSSDRGLTDRRRGGTTKFSE